MAQEPGTGQRILVADDEEYTRDLLSTALRFVGFDVAVAVDGIDALSKVASTRPELIVLDVMMPGHDGFEVVRRLRADGVGTPVIFLTARDTTEDKLAGFTKGGDDYVTKPFSLEEVVARVRAVLHRTGGASAPATRHRYADLVLDEDAHRVWRAEQPVALSPTEFNLLRYLLLNAERVLSKSQILDHVWEYDFDGDGSVVEVYMSYLRKKIDTVQPKLLHTVRGVGYTLRTEPT
ncbi:MAG: response regulator transcription factor [Acidimicrobiales bacterium]